MVSKHISLLRLLRLWAWPVLCAFTGPVYAGEMKLEFTHLKVENGLPHNHVTDVIQDRRGFMWFATRDGLARYDGNAIKTYRLGSGAEGQKSNYFYSLYEDSRGFIWVGAADGVYIYDPSKEELLPFVEITPDGTGVQGRVGRITADHGGNIWMAAYGTGVFRYDPNRRELAFFEDDGKPGSLKSNLVMDIHVDSDNCVWIGMLGPEDSGMSLFDEYTGTFSLYTLSPAQPNRGVNCIAVDKNGFFYMGSPNSGVSVMNPLTRHITPLVNNEQGDMFVNDLEFRDGNQLWIATNSGIYVNDMQTGSIRHIIYDFADPESLSGYAVNCFEFDREGGMWIGTKSGGINYLPANYAAFEKFYPKAGGNQLSGNEIRDICEDGSGILWIATERDGVNRFDPKTSRFTNYNVANRGLGYDLVASLMVVGEELWVGYLGEGGEIINTRTGTRRSFLINPNPVDHSVFSMCADRRGTIWIGTTLSLAQYDRDTGRLTPVDEIPFDTFVFDIMEDSSGRIWFATYGRGAYLFNPDENSWKHFRACDGVLGSDYCIGLSEDSSKGVWICTEGGGAMLFDPVTFDTVRYGVEEGLPSDIIYKVVDDKRGHLWFSTTRGLGCLDRQTGEYTTYTHANGILSDQFNFKSGILAANGMLYFGSTEGLMRFWPGNITRNDHVPEVVLTDFRIFNESVPIGGNSPLQSSIVTAPRIELSHNRNTIGFSFAALSYNAPGQNRYTYMLEGYDHQWINLAAGDNRSVSYANLLPGEYTFMVRGSNNDGVWNDKPASVEVVIRPPWWASTVALILYSAGLMCLLWLSYRQLRRRNRRQQEIHAKEMERTREKLVYDAKMNFFAAISHEVRTPLSLIKAPYEQVMHEGRSSENYHENMEIIGLNINRLQDLTNQLLDFPRVESNNVMFRYSLTDVVGLVGQVIHRFRPVLRLSGIELSLDLPQEPVKCYLDGEALTKIASNLLQNASKFASSFIDVEMAVGENDFSLTITNDGGGIPREARERIFESFYQLPGDNSKGGVGLGLSIVKHLVELHSGRVEIVPAAEGMACFRVVIPLLTSMPQTRSEPDVPAVSEQLSDVEEFHKDRANVLVVEDNAQMRHFLRRLLADTYNVLSASDAKAALAQLEFKHVDLVLSDVMMPGMDGFELCRHLKSRSEYSHIPVVLLTSKTHVDSKIEGMEAGADAYVEKPFSPELLLAQIASIINNKRLIREAFLNSPFTLTSSLASSRADEQFLETVNRTIIEHMVDSNFSIEQLASILGIGRATLDRKIKGVANLTTNEYIKLVRIKRAAELLADGIYRVSEICYITGFSSPSYFTKCFREQFGITPKDIMKRESTRSRKPRQD